MADFSNVVITERGKSLLARVEAEKDILMFTVIKTSDAVYTKENLYNLTDITNSKQVRNVNSVIYEQPNQIKITCNLSNEDVIDTGYNLASYGVYAKSKKHTEEILLAAASVDNINKADWVSPNSSLNAITINLSTVLIISGIEIEKVIIAEGVTIDTFTEHVNAKGVNAVHGATSDAEANQIITRDANAQAKVLYDEASAEDDTIVNKKAMDTIVKKKQGVIVNYYDDATTYEEGEVVAIEYVE